MDQSEYTTSLPPTDSSGKRYRPSDSTQLDSNDATARSGHTVALPPVHHATSTRVGDSIRDTGDSAFGEGATVRHSKQPYSHMPQYTYIP
jgi:hypothetical protein